MKIQKKVTSLALLLAFEWVGAEPARAAYSFVDSRFNQCDISVGFSPILSGIGVTGIVALPDGTARVANFQDGFFSFLLPGQPCPGLPNSPTRASNFQHADLSLGLDGNLYATIGFSNSGGADIRRLSGPLFTGSSSPLVSGLGALGLAVDPLTGDLFVTSGSVAGSQNVNRATITPPSFSVFASTGKFLDGLAWSPDGLFLLAAASTGQVLIIDRNGLSSVLVQLPPGTTPDGIVFGEPGTPLEGFAYTNNNNGTVTEIPLANPSAFTTIASGGNRGDFVGVDSQGCLLLSQVDRVTRLCGKDGGRFIKPGASLCANLLAAALAATSCDFCIVNPEVKRVINELVAGLCGNVNCSPDGTQLTLCDLINFVKSNAPNCKALLMAARALRDALSAVSPSPCPNA